MFQLFFVVGSARILSDDYTYNLTMSWCEDLKAASTDIDTSDACQTLCEGDDLCDAWLFCPSGKCQSADGNKWWGKSKCLTGTPSKCVPFSKGSWHWMGFAKTPVAPEGRTVPATRKRGFSGFTTEQYSTCDDAKALNLEGSWYYNWMNKASHADMCITAGVYPSDQGFEYVPMIESTGVNVVKTITDQVKQEWIWGNAHYLLGYNEPDQQNPFREDPKKAAAHWVTVQAAANMFDPPLILVSAAPMDSKISDEGVSPWLDEFFAECEKVVGCEPDDIEYIAFHNYHGDITQLNSTIYGMHNRYTKSDGSKRLLWLTEVGKGYWNPPSGPPLSEKITYMKELLPFVDAHPLIMRYAWFTARFDSDAADQTSWSGPTSLLPNKTAGMDLTELGQLYRDM